VIQRILRYEDYDREDKITFDTPFFITAAGSPGHSSDWNTTKLALRFNSKEVISFKNVDGVYSADPKKDPSAKKFKDLTWDEYMNLIGNPETFEPGGHYPVDILAARLAKENNIQFDIINGTDFSNFQNLLEGKEFSGTVIK
jgi:uridylate kinase